ncbi:MAG: hypothetical protein IJM61_00260 [Firmicutes bacterium]|nr:hypothetical protein [Bacillota bacterium]
MAQCVFCGEKAAIGKTITVGTMVFKACQDCYDAYYGRDDKVIVDAVRKAGLYNNEQRLAEWYDNRVEELRKKSVELQDMIDSYERKLKEEGVGTCPKCGAVMLEREKVDLIYANGDLPTLNLTFINTAQLKLRMVVCEQCGYTEFYSAGPDNYKRIEQNRIYLKEIKEELGEE